MTLHQLTHSVGYEFDLGLGRILRRVSDQIADWAAERRLNAELARLDHRELADLASRR